MAQPVPLSFGAYKRTGFPEAITVNCFAEKSPTSQSNPEALLARPGLEEFKVVGSTPHRGIIQRPGLFSDAALLVANTVLYTLDSQGIATALSGAVDGDGLVDMDMGQDADLNSVLRIATGDALYQATNAGSVTLEDFPSLGGAGASSVCYHSGFWIAVEAGTDVFYYQLPGETAWDALEFASAEYAPDPLVAVRSVGDIVALLGSATFEPWTLTGTAVPPFEPYGGLKRKIGCRARDAAVVCGGSSLIWVTDSCSVVKFEGGEPEIISDNGLAEQIRRTSAMDLRASTYSKDQHVYYVLRLGTTATWVYDLTTGTWARADSLSYDYWRAHLFANIGDTALALDSLSNQVWRLDPDRLTDGDDTFTMQFCAFAEAPNGPIPCVNLVLPCEVGAAPLTGQGSDPKVVLTMSDNGGKTYGPPRERSLGATGNYNTLPKWTGLGTIPALIGRIFKFAISDPVGRRVYPPVMNVP